MVRWLEDCEGMFDALSDVRRTGPFEAAMVFHDESSAASLAAALRSSAVPAAMRAAMEALVLSGREVQMRFRAVREVALTDRGAGHTAACVLEEATG